MVAVHHSRTFFLSPFDFNCPEAYCLTTESKPMRILYIFPHPDDESFGPAPVINQQVENGHEVFLLTLTRGGATKVRHKLGLSVKEMGVIRYREMLQVEKVLRLTGMKVIDLPDSGLSEMDPRQIEEEVSNHIERIHPQLVVSYPVHGVSGHHDHLVTHAVVKKNIREFEKCRSILFKKIGFCYASQESGGTNDTGRVSPKKQ